MLKRIRKRVGKLTLPIERLFVRTVEISKRNLGVRVEPSTKDAFGRRTESFNQMIHDLKQSQEALKEAEEKYRRIFENSKDMVFINSVDGRFLEVNRAGLELLGYASREELQHLSARDTYLNPADRKRFQEEMVREGFVKDFEVKLKRKDETAVDCLITATARKDENGEVVGYEGIIKDISDRKRMEEDLLRRTQELQTLYDLGVLVNQSLDLDSVLSTALDRALALTGFEMGTIHFLDKDEETLELKSEKGNPPNITENVKVFKVGEGVCGKVAKLKKPVILSIDEYPTPRLIPVLEKEGIRTLAGIPLLAKGRVIGAITLMSRFSHSLTEREINLLESIGMQIGLALENAKLFSAVARGKSEWETTFDAVTDLITIRDREYRILRANRAALKRYGLAPAAIIGKRCYEALHNRDMFCEGCYITETLRTRRAASGERESKYLSGVFHHFTFPVLNEAGEIVAVVDLAREVTEQKRLEVEKEVFNNINRILASSLDMRQVIKSVHSELQRVLNSERMTITLSETGGKGFRYFASEKDEDVEERVAGALFPSEGTPFEQVVATGKPIIVPDTEKSDTWVNQKLRKEGIRSSLVFPLEYQGSVIGTINFGSRKINHFTEDHVRFLYQVATGLAISIENSLLLDETKGSEERYRTVVESAHDGVGVIGDDFQIRYANQRLAEILLYPREELIGMDFRNLLDGESRQLVEDRYVRKQKGDEVLPRYEFNIVRKDGEIRNVEISSSMVRDSRGSVNTISFVEDRTERKRFEEKLLQTEKLRALGEMASGVAHDFNNALAAILGNAQLMLYTVKDEEIRGALQTIERVARDSANTVKRLQEFTRRKTHKELLAVEMNTIIRDAVEITRPRWKDETQRKGLQIEIALDLGEISPVAGNDSELIEVITIMIFNAIEAMAEGGSIEIRSFQKGDRISIEISDTGVGMTEEVKRKIFEPFFTTKPFSNTGLGLSMSYGIINRLGGEIEVQSRAGKGTRFTITLPVRPGESDAIPPSSCVRREEKARILMIDDEASPLCPQRACRDPLEGQPSGDRR
jgi:PAS domain S-box-containing protein